MSRNMKRNLIMNLPFIAVGLFCTNIGEALRISTGSTFALRMQEMIIRGGFGKAFSNPLPSLHPFDILIGALCGGALKLAVYMKGKNAKKYRHNIEYGSARWGTHADIEPFEDPVFENNVILSQTERLTMNSRPKEPKYARNKNVLIVGGSGSGKTRYWIKPNLLQMHSSYILTDPKGGLVNETGMAFLRAKYKIKIFNTINFKKSMHYNPIEYIHSEKDILKPQLFTD